jgi:hypothetical protein
MIWMMKSDGLRFTLLLIFFFSFKMIPNVFCFA